MDARDAKSVALALAGRREGFRDLFERHRTAVARLARSFVALDADEIDDAVDEALARAFERLSGLKEPSRFGPFALLVARQRFQARVARKGSATAVLAALSEDLPELAPDPGPEELKRAAAAEALLPAPAGLVDPRLAAFLSGDQRLSDAGSPAGEEALRGFARLRARLKAVLAAMLLEQRRGPVPPAGPEAAAHLGDESWRQILRGERFTGESRLAAHLRSRCEVCEAFLAGLGKPDGLDGEADALLLSAPPASRHDPSGLAFERVIRRVRLDLRISGGGAVPLGARPSKALPLAMAGGLALLGAAVLLIQQVPSIGRVSSGPQVSVAFFVAEPGQEKGSQAVSGASCTEQHALLLRYRLASPAFVTVLRAGPGGRPEELASPGRLGSGWHSLSVEGMPARISLVGAAGTNRFVVLASERPLSREEAEGAAAGELADEEIARAEFSVEVKPAREAQRASDP